MKLNVKERKRLYTVQDLIPMTELCRETIHKLGRTGKIPGMIRLGRSIRFKGDIIENWLTQKEKTE